MATYPVLPDKDREYTAKEYPPNREVKKLARVMMKTESSQIPTEEKQQLAKSYKIPESEISAEYDMFTFCKKAADIVFEEDLPPDVDAEDISSRAVMEGIYDFFGVGGNRRGGQRAF